MATGTTGGNIDTILRKAAAAERLTRDEALALYRHGDFLSLLPAAQARRNRLHDPSRVTYTLFRVVNYTNVCATGCSFCGFHVAPGTTRGKVLSPEDILMKLRAAVAAGARQLFLQGGVNPAIPFDYYLDVLRAVKKEFGAGLHIRAFSPAEINGMSCATGRSVREVIRELRAAGLNSVPGAGAEILSDRVRAVLSPRKLAASDWIRIMEICHEEGLPGSANIVIGSIETPEEIIEHLAIIRALQDRTGGLLAFIPWTFQKQTANFPLRTVPVREYLKLLAICRLFLDNIPHIEASVLGLGREVGEMALYAGADDISSVVFEENVLTSRGLATEAEARAFIEASGFMPNRRDLLYQQV